MSKTKPKRSSRPEGKLKTKDQSEAKKGEKHDDAQTSQKSAANQWSDWIWDEELKGYYRAKLVKGDQWIYEYAYPEVHPATKNEKFVYPKVVEKVVFVEPKYKFEAPKTKGSQYLVSVCEEMRDGSVISGEPWKAEGGKSGEKAAVKVKGEEKAQSGTEVKVQKVGSDRVYKWRDEVNEALQLGESSDDDRGNGRVKKQRRGSLSEDSSAVLTNGEAEKEGTAKKKDSNKRHESKENRHR